MNYHPIRFPTAAALIAVCAAEPALAQDVQPVPLPTQAAPIVSTLPGGASSLTEQHGDWTVSCVMTQQGKDCQFSQALGNAQTGQRALSVELRPTGENKVEGMLLTPFSLRLDGGVNLAIDDKPLQGPLPFLACIELGCLVPVTFDGDVYAGLRAGTVLQFSAIPLNGAEPIKLSISLAGFTNASNRTAELAR